MEGGRGVGGRKIRAGEEEAGGRGRIRERGREGEGYEKGRGGGGEEG